MQKSIVIVIFFISSVVYGQDRIGLISGNYSGINSALINPSNLSSSRYYLDINVAGGGLFLFNNAVFLRKEDYKVKSFLSRNIEFRTFINDRGDERYVDEYTNIEAKDVHLNTHIIGPSAMLVYGKHAFGIHTGVHSVLSGTRVPYEIVKFLYEGLDYEPLHNINFIEDKPFDLSILNWTEIAAVYSYNVFSRNYDKIDVGISLKYLLGHSSMYAHINNIDFEVPNDSTLDINNMNGEIGFSVPVNYSNNKYPDGSGFFKGRGVGFSIGASYIRTEKIQRRYNKFLRFCRQPSVRYKFKLGVSLLDIGYINFNKNIQEHSYDNVSTYWENIDDESFDNANDLMSTLSSRLYNGDENASNKQVSSYRAVLPSALSVHFDYHYFDAWYVNVLFLHGFATSYKGPRRSSVIAISPRYETPFVEVQLPVSLYQYKYPRIGLSGRIGIVTIGTDNIGYILGMKNFDGMDIYFALKFNISKGNCGRKGNGRCQNYHMIM